MAQWLKNPHCNAGHLGSISAQGTKSPHAAEKLCPCFTTIKPPLHNEASHIQQLRPDAAKWETFPKGETLSVTLPMCLCACTLKRKKKKWGNWGSEWLSNLPKVIQLRNEDNGETQTVSSVKIVPLLSVTNEVSLTFLIFWHVYISQVYHFAFYCGGFRI